LNLFNSTGNGPVRSSGSSQFELAAPQPVRFNRIYPWPAWMESVWVDPTGVVFGWYHQEHFGVCPGSRLSVPQIGAAISYDGGNTFEDLGTILSSGDPIDCNSQNGYFAGGHGDFSVILDRTRTYFYFFFTNYAGPLEQQGVAVARMPFESRFYPEAAVTKFYMGVSTQPGIRGRVTPVLPAQVSWSSAGTNSYWGPSIHWNTHLNEYVMLLNRSCCSPGFPRKGIYASFSSDISSPESWTAPRKILNDTGWYPQVLGLGDSGTDRRAGRVAGLYIYGHSRWEIVFEKAPEPPQPAQ
jgi:hypothetical protein